MAMGAALMALAICTSTGSLGLTVSACIGAALAVSGWMGWQAASTTTRKPLPTHPTSFAKLEFIVFLL
jgi:hypothetical protein